MVERIRFIHDFVSRQVEANPEKIAVYELDNFITYRELNDLAISFSVRMHKLGVSVGDRVILKMENSINAVALIVGSSILGVTFVPVSPQTPDRRFQKIVKQVQPALIAEEDSAKEIQMTEVNYRPLLRKESRLISEDIAYIVFTSGSTGIPKGIAMSHRAVIAFWVGMQESLLTESSNRIGTLCPLQFDLSIVNLGLMLCAGASLVIVPVTMFYSPKKFIKYIHDKKVSMMCGAPSIWAPLIQSELEKLKKVPNLRKIFFAGENFPLANLRKIMSTRRDIKIINCFGHSESMACSVYEIANPLPSNMEKLPIGTGLPGTEIFILDDEKKNINRPFEIGELYVRGDNLFSGYLNNSPETRKRLLFNKGKGLVSPFVFRSGDMAYKDEEGLFYFCGRRDFQVQISGRRVEVEEIETAIKSHSMVSDACVIAIEKNTTQVLACLFVPIHGKNDELSTQTFRRYLGNFLPDYMIPRFFNEVGSIPLTLNGKFDRKKAEEMIVCEIAI